MEAHPDRGPTNPSSPSPIPRPHEIVAALDRTVHGQSDAKRALAFAVYAQCLGNAAAGGGNRPTFGRQHVLLIGPTGVGKSLLVRRLGEIVGLPVAICTATSLVETGYVGEQVDACVRSLLAAAGGDPERARCGIVFLDEIDKIKKASGGIRDVSGEGVQNALLTLLDGIDVRIRAANSPEITVHTGGILFVCAGAFSGLADIVRSRRGEQGRIGFAEPEGLDTQVGLAGFETEDLVRFGMIPEFVGRFATVTALESLDQAGLVAILRDCADSALQRARMLCAIHGTELDVSEAALRVMADRALQMGTGARALDRVVRSVLEPVIWRILTSDRPVARAVVDRSVASGLRPARLVFAEGSRTTSMADLLAQRAREPHDPAAVQPGQRTDPTGWTAEALRRRLEAVKDRLGWGETTGTPRKWWESFESENAERLPVVLRLAEELLARNATITEFFLAYVYSNTDNIQANLHYLDYSRLKKDEERRKKEQGRDEPGPASAG